MPKFLIKATKFIVAIAALPMLPPLGRSLWLQISQIQERTLFFENPLSLCVLGGIVWIVFDMLFHVPTRIYIFAHELTHALFIKLSGGRIKKIAVEHDRGFVESNRSNFIIVLAPYLFPFYAMILIMGSVLLAAFIPFSSFNTGFWILLGVGLGYHWTMTAKMLTTRQTDFSSQGYFFSFILIFLVNGLMLWSLFLVLPKPLNISHQTIRLSKSVLESYRAVGDAFSGLVP
jgi:hypothetical protein